jgi:hypothetical protein
LTSSFAEREDSHFMGKEAARRALEAQLGHRAPEGLERLSEEELSDLGEAVKLARRRQAAALADAGERALNRIPRLLRGPIRKIAGG